MSSVTGFSPTQNASYLNNSNTSAVQLPSDCQAVYEKIISSYEVQNVDMFNQGVNILFKIYSAHNSDGMLRALRLVDYLCETQANSQPIPELPTTYSILDGKYLIGAMLYNLIQDVTDSSIESLISEFKSQEPLEWKLLHPFLVKLPETLITNPKNGERYSRDSYQLLKLDEEVNVIYRAAYIGSVVNDLKHGYFKYTPIWVNTMLHDLTNTECFDRSYETFFATMKNDLQPYSEADSNLPPIPTGIFNRLFGIWG